MQDTTGSLKMNVLVFSQTKALIVPLKISRKQAFSIQQTSWTDLVSFDELHDAVHLFSRNPVDDLPVVSDQLCDHCRRFRADFTLHTNKSMFSANNVLWPVTSQSQLIPIQYSFTAHPT